jgi:hypothetical protein
MKKILLFAISSLAAQISYGQYNSQWRHDLLNYNVGIGTKNTATANNLPLPNFNLHLHGTADWIVADKFNPAITTNYGKTTRLGFTNTSTGVANTDGTEFRMSGNDFSIDNRENGNLSISTNGSLSVSVPNVGMTFSNSSSRIWVGTLSNMTSTDQARMNIIAPSSDNGLFIQSSGTKYALSLKTSVNTTEALLVRDASNVGNFSVKGNGEVNTKDLFVNGKLRVTDGTTNVFSVDNTGLIRSREILVDDLPIPDYVFKPDYKLMTLKEVEQYISKFHHLPNVKSELEFQEAGGVQLGEMNLKLLEKVEELTLYVIDLQKQIDELKNK